MLRLFVQRFRRDIIRVGVSAALMATVVGCTPAEKPPATPPKLPPMPARPANAGPGSDRYQQMMKNSPAKTQYAAPK